MSFRIGGTYVYTDVTSFLALRDLIYIVMISSIPTGIKSLQLRKALCKHMLKWRFCVI